jgi:hypothetical protein
MSKHVQGSARHCKAVEGVGSHFSQFAGFLANRRRAAFLPLCFDLLGAAQEPQADQKNAADSNGLWRCPKCGGPMVVAERLTAAEIQLRSPPLLTSAAWNQFAERGQRMNHSVKAMRVVRRMSHSQCVALLMLTCGALSAQNEEHREVPEGQD